MPVEVHSIDQYLDRSRSRSLAGRRRTTRGGRAASTCHHRPARACGVRGRGRHRRSFRIWSCRVRLASEILETWCNANVVCFDMDSNVCLAEGSDELTGFCAAEQAVDEWTAKAMTWNVPFEEAHATWIL